MTPGAIPGPRPRSRRSPVPGGSIASVIRGADDAGGSPGASAPAGSARIPPMASASIASMAERTFIKFTFLKIDPAWQRRGSEQRAQDKRELLAACDDFAEDRPLRAYSTVGTRGDCDLLLVSQSPHLDEIHKFHVVLAQSGLAQWASIPYSYLAMTKPSPYSDSETPPELLTSRRSTRSSTRWRRSGSGTRCAGDERRRIMTDHIETGRRYPQITINTAYSFGIDDQEFVVSFECDDPGRLPRPRPGAARDRIQRLDPSRHPDLLVRLDVRRAGARRSRRRRHLTPRPRRRLTRVSHCADE